jgi:hypothetical protein
VHRWLIRLLLACGVAALVGACAPRASPEVRVGLLAREVDILQALFGSAAVPISTDPFCAGIASPETRTIGRLVAGLLAAQERDRRNWVQIWTGTENPPDWTLDVMFISGVADRDGLDWGVRYQLLPGGDRLVDLASFRCFTGWYE